MMIKCVHLRLGLVGFTFMLHFLINSPVQAVELGIDTGLTLQIVDNDSRNIINVGLPAPDNLGLFSVQTTRVGFTASATSQVEGSRGCSLISEEQTYGGRRSIGHLVMGAAYLQDLRGPGHAVTPYIRGGGQWRQIMATGTPSLTQFGLGAGLGLRIHRKSTLGGRLETSGTRWFENQDVRGHWDLAVRLGLSVFTK